MQWLQILVRYDDMICSGDSRIKKVGGPLRGQGKSRGGQQSYLLDLYRTYVNQMNLNGKLRKKLGGQTGDQAKIWGGHGPPLESPLMICLLSFVI